MNGVNRHKTRILVTDAGHIVTPSTLESLRQNNDEDYYIVGVDVDADAIGFCWTDSHYTVPSVHAEDYLDRIVEISQKENIEVVVPWTDDEVEVISRSASVFEELGIAILCSTYSSIERTVDKGRLLRELMDTDIPVPRFTVASSSKDVEKAVFEMGYPSKSVVVKPCRSSGGRGLWILDQKTDLLQRYPGRRLPLSALSAVLSEAERANQRIPEYIVMQYLEGDHYSVDVLADHGESIFVIPRRRIKAIQGASQVGELHPNAEVRTMVTRIIRHFDLHLNINVQLGLTEDSVGIPLTYEINPRISGTVVANAAAGIDLLHYGIQMALGRKVPHRGTVQVRQGRMVRYWSEHYDFDGGHFEP